MWQPHRGRVQAFGKNHKIKGVNGEQGNLSLYGHWPSVINLYPFFIEELKDKLSRQDFETVQSRISLVPDEEHLFLVMDDPGNVYDYCHDLEGKPSQSTEKAIDWLKIDAPDYYD